MRNLFVTGTKKNVIKNIHPSITKEHIRESIRKQLHQNSFIKRFHLSTTKKPLPIISITCHTETVTKLLKNRLTILQKHHLCEPYKKPVICCYNCQLFGHIAKYCTKDLCVTFVVEKSIQAKIL